MNELAAKHSGNSGLYCLRASIGVVYLAVGFVALRQSTHAWFRSMNMLIISILLFSILKALLAAKPFRSFWLGFAVFGCGYYAFVFGPWTTTWHSPFREVEISAYVVYPRPVLVTSYIVDLLVSSITGIPLSQLSSLSNDDAPELLERAECAVCMSHLLITPIIGLIGGVISRQMMIQLARAETSEPETKSIANK